MRKQCIISHIILCFIFPFPETLEDRQGTTGEFATIPFHIVPSLALAELAKSIPVIKIDSPSSSVCPILFCLSMCPVRLSLLNQKTLRRGETILVFASCPGSGIHHNLRRMLEPFCFETSHGQHGPCTKCSIVFDSISSQRSGFFSLTLQSWYDLQAYRNMEMTRMYISFTFDSRDMLLALQIGFHFMRATVACPILDRISGLEPPFETTAPRYFKVVTIPSFCLFFNLYLPLDAIGTVCHKFCLIITNFHLIPCAGFAETFNQGS